MIVLNLVIQSWAGFIELVIKWTKEKPPIQQGFLTILDCGTLANSTSEGKGLLDMEKEQQGCPQDWLYITWGHGIFHWHWEHAWGMGCMILVSMKYTLAMEHIYRKAWRGNDCHHGPFDSNSDSVLCCCHGPLDSNHTTNQPKQCLIIAGLSALFLEKKI